MGGRLRHDDNSRWLSAVSTHRCGPEENGQDHCRVTTAALFLGHPLFWWNSSMDVERPQCCRIAPPWRTLPGLLLSIDRLSSRLLRSDGCRQIWTVRSLVVDSRKLTYVGSFVSIMLGHLRVNMDEAIDTLITVATTVFGDESQNAAAPEANSTHLNQTIEEMLRFHYSAPGHPPLHSITALEEGAHSTSRQDRTNLESLRGHSLSPPAEGTSSVHGRAPVETAEIEAT
jgi:hypothetical protein